MISGFQKYLCVGFALMCFTSLLGQNWRESFEAGQKAFQSGKYAEALKLFKDAQDLAPSDVNILDLINRSAYRSENYSDAVKGYEQATKQAQTNSEKSQASYNLGNSHFKNNNIDQAIESYKEALRKDPNNEKARYNLAYAMKQKQKQSENENDEKQNDEKQNDEKQNDEKQNENENDEKQNENENKNGGNPQISPDQTEQLLDALLKAEQQSKEKLDKEKDKGVPLSERKKKDW